LNGSFSLTFAEFEPGTYNVSIETVDGHAEITNKVEVTETEGEEGGVETTTTTESSGNETNTTVLEFVEPDAVTSRNRADAASVARASFHAALATVPTARSTVLRDPSG